MFISNPGLIGQKRHELCRGHHSRASSHPFNTPHHPYQRPFLIFVGLWGVVHTYQPPTPQIVGWAICKAPPPPAKNPPFDETDYNRVLPWWICKAEKQIRCLRLLIWIVSNNKRDEGIGWKTGGGKKGVSITLASSVAQTNNFGRHR